MTTKKYTAAELIEMEQKYGAHNYHPLPVVLISCRPIRPSTRGTATPRS